MPSILIEYGHEVKTVSKQCQNGHILDTECQRLQENAELHQKDLRINLKLVHIWDPENEAVLGADTFLALSLIVPLLVSRGSITVRRVDIPVKRPCKLSV